MEQSQRTYALTNYQDVANAELDEGKDIWRHILWKQRKIIGAVGTTTIMIKVTFYFLHKRKLEMAFQRHWCAENGKNSAKKFSKHLWFIIYYLFIFRGKVQVKSAAWALCARLYVKWYTSAPVVILLYAQHHALMSTTQKRYYHKVDHSDMRGEGTHEKKAPQCRRQGDSQK